MSDNGKDLAQVQSSAPSDDVAPRAPRKEPAERLALHANPRPVTRLNRTTLLVLIGGLAVAIFASALWGLRRPSNSGVSAEQPRNVEHISRAEGLDALPADYASIPQPKSASAPLRLGAPIGELGRPVLREEQRAGIPPLPERPTFAPSPEEDALRTQRLKDEQNSETANTSAVFVQLKRRAQADHTESTPESGPSTAVLPQPETTFSPRAPTAPTAQEHKVAFLNSVGANEDSRIYASGNLQTPRARAQLMAGTIISAALISGINSDLPGQIEAQVTSSVYDTVTGRLLLIPQGSRLLGQYDSQITYGQSRVLLAWSRLIMPDGSSITLDRIPGTDTKGQAGLQDQVDWHAGRLASGAALSTLLSVATALAEPNQVATNGSGVIVVGVRQGAQDTLNQVGQEITRRNLDVQPTLRIRPGFPVTVIVNKDLILRPYES